MKNESGEYFLVTKSRESGFVLDKGIGKAQMIVPKGFFNNGTYIVELAVNSYSEKNGYQYLFHDPEVFLIDILPEKRNIGQWMGEEKGQIRHVFNWIK